jgi:hypothetical protein
MAYLDGEVEESQIPEVLALLAKSDSARRIVEQHEAVAEWVRASTRQRAVAARTEDIAGAVMARVAELDRPYALGQGRAKGVRSRDRVLAFGVFCAAAAAVFLFYLWPPRSGQSSGANGGQAGAIESAPPSAVGSAELAPPGFGSGEPAAPTPIAAAEPEGEGVDVQAVESPHHPISIFYMPAATGANAHASSVVVWIGEE